jgi:DNA polymerase-3 subunit alpha
MKANFPVDYMAAVLTAANGDVEEIAGIVAECKRMGINILPPSVNESKGTFTVVDSERSRGVDANPSNSSGQAIRFGLYSIKNFGTGVGDSIMAARDSGGVFKDMADFLTRVTDKNLNKKSLESLIECGALGEYGERGHLMANIETLLGFHREHINVPTNQDSLFGAMSATPASLRLVDAPPASMEQKLLWEKELLGLYISGHPLDKHKAILSKQKMDLKTSKVNFPRGAETVIAGFLQEARTILTKNGEKMMFAKLADFSDTVEIVSFPRTLKEATDILIVGTCIAVKGRFSERNGEASFIVEKAKKL